MQKNAHTFDDYRNFMVVDSSNLLFSVPRPRPRHPASSWSPPTGRWDQWAHAFCVPVLNRLSARSHTHNGPAANRLASLCNIRVILRFKLPLAAAT